MGGEAFERQRAENAAILAALERKKEARTMAVPTNDVQVRARLREIGHPICLFGEGVSASVRGDWTRLPLTIVGWGYSRVTDEIV